MFSDEVELEDVEKMDREYGELFRRRELTLSLLSLE